MWNAVNVGATFPQGNNNNSAAAAAVYLYRATAIRDWKAFLDLPSREMISHPLLTDIASTDPTGQISFKK